MGWEMPFCRLLFVCEWKPEPSGIKSRALPRAVLRSPSCAVSTSCHLQWISPHVSCGRWYGLAIWLDRKAPGFYDSQSRPRSAGDYLKWPRPDYELACETGSLSGRDDIVFSWNKNLAGSGSPLWRGQGIFSPLVLLSLKLALLNSPSPSLHTLPRLWIIKEFLSDRGACRYVGRWSFSWLKVCVSNCLLGSPILACGWGCGMNQLLTLVTGRLFL